MALAALVLVGGGACDPGEREAQPFAGIWQSVGYGWFLDVHGGEVDVYEHTAIHCQEVASGTARGISDVISVEEGNLVLRDAGRVVRFLPIESLPPRCSDPVDPTDAAAAFEVAAATVREQYLPSPGGAWEAERSEIAAGLASDAGPEQLYQALVDLLGPLRDPEVRLAIEAEALPDSWSVDSGSVGEALTTHPDVQQLSGGLFTRDVGDNLAYLGAVRLAARGDGEQRAMAAALDSVLAGAEGLVIDLRGASGGLEEAYLLVATRFVTTEQVVAILLARDGEAVVPSGELSVRPLATGGFGGPVVVLVGPSTSGAGELLALVLAELPRVTLVGEPTAGSPRDPLVRSLPNGWSIGVPNLEVIGPDGSHRVGMPLQPDIDVPSTLDDLRAGLDPGLEAALEVLRND
jgi:hypothetical protein